MNCNTKYLKIIVVLRLLETVFFFKWGLEIKVKDSHSCPKTSLSKALCVQEVGRARWLWVGLTCVSPIRLEQLCPYLGGCGLFFSAPLRWSKHPWFKSQAAKPVWNPFAAFSLEVLPCCCSVARLGPRLCDPMGCSTPGSSILHFQNMLQFMSKESVMPSNHLILCCPIPLLPSIFPSIRVFTNESALHIRWPKYWSFSFSISPSNEDSELISFRMDWLDLLAVQGTLKSLLQHHSLKGSILRHSAFFIVQLSHPYITTGKTIALTVQTFVGKMMSLFYSMLCIWTK